MTTKHPEFAEICRRNGWKCTPQRLAVYNFVSGRDLHTGVDEVRDYVRQRLPSVTRESIYRILNEFAGRGMLRRLDHLDSARYDSRTTPHGHFICEECGEITDFALPGNISLPVDELAGEARHIEFRVCGICRKCRKSNQNQ